MGTVSGTFDSWSLDAFYRQFSADPLLAEFYDDSGYANLGYWDDTTRTAPEACDRLVDRLVATMGDDRGRVLDVACGCGGTTRRLCSHFETGDVSAINLSSWQLAEATERAPKAHFHRMDAASMGFAARCFDAVVCVEAALHFSSRRDFLYEAFRVLRPGGVIALSDLLMAPGAPTVPSTNFLPDAAAYSAGLEDVGFESVRVEPARERSLDGFRLSFSDHITANRTLSNWLVFARDLYFTNVTMPAMIRDVLLGQRQKAAVGVRGLSPSCRRPLRSTCSRTTAGPVPPAEVCLLG